MKNMKLFITIVFGMLAQGVVAVAYQKELKTSALLTNPGNQIYNEEQSYVLNITANPSARIFVSGLPPGMLWDEAGRRFDFRPDFIQGGKSWQVTMEAIDGGNVIIESFTVTVNNNIQPPWPTVTNEEYLSFPRMTKFTLTQVTDDFLDSPGYVGREFTSTMVVPDAASTENLLPLGMWLHGFGGSAGTGGGRYQFAISPHDSNNTWWTGYNNQHPDGVVGQGTVPNYTQRRVMHLLSYLTEHYPGVDMERVSIGGQSMGGTGSYFITLRYARHFSSLFSRIGGTASQLLSDGQQTMLRTFWGGAIDLGLVDDLGMNVWESYDASRGLLDNHDFRNLHFSTVVGQNDPTINFRHVVGLSPVTDMSFIDMLQQEGVGHHIVWDQRAHGSTEGPPLGANWWEPLDDASAIVRNKAFPAFTNSSTDEDPGVPDGLGGFTGSLRGVINRYQRWDSENIVDSREQLSIPLKVDIDTSGTPPADPQYPPMDNFYYGSLPITTDVTIRRIQNFQLLAGEAVNWDYNGLSGVAFANGDGSVTVTNLPMMPTYADLTLSRTLEAVSPSISTQPVSQNIDEGASVTFGITVVGSAPLAYQWFRNNLEIPGATGSSYTIQQVSAVDDGALYHCEVNNNLGNVASNDAVLTVIMDTTAPSIDEAVVQSANQVYIRFSETVTRASAETLGNYQISDGIQVVGAVLDVDNKTIRLQTDSLEPDSVYTVTVNNIQDTSSGANQILSDSSVVIVFSPVINFDNGALPFGWIPLTASRWSVVEDGGNNALFLNTTAYNPLSGFRLGEHIISPDTYTDFSLKVEAKTNENSGEANADYALVFGFENGENYFYMLFNRTQSNTQLFKVANGIRQVIGTATANITDDEYHAVEIRRVADEIEIRFDDSIVLEIIDSSFPSGRLGLGSFNDSAYFDDIRITGKSSLVLNDLIFSSSFE